jgi:hypothetical protein
VDTVTFVGLQSVVYTGSELTTWSGDHYNGYTTIDPNTRQVRLGHQTPSRHYSLSLHEKQIHKDRSREDQKYHYY